MDVFDVHHHLGSLFDASFDMTATELADHHLSVMDRYGVDAAAVLPSPTYPNPDGLADTRAKNEQVAAVHEAHPDRFPVTFGTVEPWYGEAGLDEVDRLLESLDGIMWHNRWQRAPVNAPMVYDMVERAAEHDALVGLHAHAGSDLTAPWRVFEVTESFPDVQFVVFDALSSVEQSDEIIGQVEDVTLDNVVFDTALAPRMSSQLPEFVEAVGHEHVVFGTDVYSHSDTPYTTLPFEQFDECAFDDDVGRAILRGNASRVFNLD